MKNSVRDKISRFLKSEEGRVGVKSPLTLGAASASLLLAHAMVAPSAQAHMECDPDNPCTCGESMVCKEWCATMFLNVCMEWEAHCEFP